MVANQRPASALRPGRDYPRNYAELRAWFPDDEACIDYLDWLRWHRIASLLKRWLLGTHQGAVEADHLQGYLDEYAFRFNRRQAEFRGLLFRRLLEQAVAVGPVTYRSLVANPSAKRKTPQPPGGHPARAPSLTAGARPHRPWRHHNP